MPPPATPTNSQLPSQSELERLRRNLAEILGEPNLKTIEPEWIAKMRDGALTTLHIGRWGGTTEAEDSDFGLVTTRQDKAARRQAWLQYGAKLLLPRRYLTRLGSIDTSARKWLARCALRTYWGYFLTTEVYPQWKARNEEQYRRPYLALRDEIVADYPAIVTEVLAEHRKLALDAYEANSRREREFRLRHPSAKAWAAEQVEKARRAIPSAERIRDSMYFEVELAFIPLPSLLADDLAAAARIADEERAAAELRRDMARIAREQKEALITTFMRDTVAKIQGLLYEVSTDILSSVRENRKLVGKSAEQMRNLIAGLEQYLKFAPNDEVAQTLIQLRGFLDIPPGKERQAAIPTLEQQLEAVAILSRDVLVRLGDNPRSARDLGIPDTPAPDLIRTARRTLTLDALPDEPPPDLLQQRVPRRSAVETGQEREAIRA